MKLLTHFGEWNHDDFYVNSWKIVVIEKDEIIGSAAVNLNSNEPDRLHFYSLFVNLQHRSKGVASQILNKAEEIAKERGIHYLYQEVRKKDKNIVRWHKRRNYKFHKTNDVLDLVILRKNFKSEVVKTQN